MMICLKANIPNQLVKVNDELKAIYHSENSICIWIFKTRNERDKFMDETVGMKKNERENHFINIYKKKPQLKVEVQSVRVKGLEPPSR